MPEYTELKDHYRQGDVLFIKIDKVPSGLQEKDDKVVVEGEATGHAHRLQGGDLLFREQWGRGIDLFINATPNGAQITHEEHNTIDLPEGNYLVRRQREYSEVENRLVLD